MGRDYTPNNDGDDFSVNFTGAALLGALHSRFGLDCTFPRFEGDPPCTPFTMSPEQARSNGAALAVITDAHLDRMYDELQLYPSWVSDDKAGFRRWVRSWQRFLQECGGYEVMI